MINKEHACILIVDDIEGNRFTLERRLKRDGFENISMAENGNIALELLKKKDFDLLLLDLMMPGISGLDVLKTMKADPRQRNIPVIMVTASDEIETAAECIVSGADDFITKPFSMGILIARIRANLRQSIVKGGTEDEHRFGALTLLPQQHIVKVNSKTVEFSNAEFKLLFFLVQKPGWVYSRDQLIDACKGENYIITDRSIDVMMVSIRKKLADYAKCIKTVRGVGYKFVDPNEL